LGLRGLGLTLFSIEKSVSRLEPGAGMQGTGARKKTPGEDFALKKKQHKGQVCVLLTDRGLVGSRGNAKTVLKNQVSFPRGSTKNAGKDSSVPGEIVNCRGVSKGGSKNVK